MGGGDIKLALAIGLGLGWRLGLLALAPGRFDRWGGVGSYVAHGAAQKSVTLCSLPKVAGAWLGMFLGERLLDLYISVVFIKLHGKIFLKAKFFPDLSKCAEY